MCDRMPNQSMEFFHHWRFVLWEFQTAHLHPPRCDPLQFFLWPNQGWSSQREANQAISLCFPCQFLREKCGSVNCCSVKLQKRDCHLPCWKGDWKLQPWSCDIAGRPLSQKGSICIWCSFQSLASWELEWEGLPCCCCCCVAEQNQSHHFLHWRPFH